MDRFFSYCPDGGFETHATAEEAESAADEALGHFRDEAPDDGWSDDVTGICWGEIKGIVQETERRMFDPATDVAMGILEEGVEMVDYGVLPLAPKPTWLLYRGPRPPELAWGPSSAPRRIEGMCKKQRLTTPTEFRDLLLTLARNVETQALAG